MSTCWELIREWLREKTGEWNLALEFERYKTVKISEAKLSGLPPPTFDDEPPLPEADVTKESTPAALDDPAASPEA